VFERAGYLFCPFFVIFVYMTGAEFYSQLQQKYDKAYSQYLDSSKANRLVKEAMYRLCDKLYSNLDTQKEYDELIEMIKNDVGVSVASGKATLPSDYLHLFRVAFKYSDSIVFSSGSLSGEYVSSRHLLRKGDIVNSAQDGSGTEYLVLKTSGNSFFLDSASASSPVYLIRTYEASPAFSDRKKGSLSAARKETPKYQTNTTGTNRELICDPAPYSIVMDYMVLPPHDIDVTDGVIDILDYYTQKFLYRLLDECVYSVATETRDYQNKRSSQETIIENP